MKNTRTPLTNDQKEIQSLRSALEVIQSIGRKSTQSHDQDCPCATCLLTTRATNALKNIK